MIAVNWRLFILFCGTLLLFYLYISFLPPDDLYNQLFNTEIQDSQKLTRNERGNKYVKFRQLQGAGFNNQVSPSLKRFDSLIQ